MKSAFFFMATALANTLPLVNGQRDRKLKRPKELKLQDGHCAICSRHNWTFPESLTIEYNPEGVDSIYQPKTFISCNAGSFPNSTTLSIMTKTGKFQLFPVDAGAVFTVIGPFNRDSFFMWNSDGLCSIDTSCGTPLVAGDQLGPFKILDGNDCAAFSLDGGSSMLPSSVPSSEPSSIPSGEPSSVPSALPSGEPSRVPSALPSGLPSGLPSVVPSSEPSNIPSGEPSSVPSAIPSGIPSLTVSSLPSGAPSSGPSAVSSGVPSVGGECLALDKTIYTCYETLEVSFDFGWAEDVAPLTDDWVGIYPCNETVYDEFQAKIWKWTCEEQPCTSPVRDGHIHFDSLPSYNEFAEKPEWPVRPDVNADGSINRCFKAVLLRNTGNQGLFTDLISEPICESAPFDIYESPFCPLY